MAIVVMEEMLGGLDEVKAALDQAIIVLTDLVEGRVTEMHFTVSYQQSKLIAIDKQPDDDVMHLGRAGKADRLAHQAFDPGAQRQVLALNLLRVALARLVRIRLEMTRVRAPIVCIIPRDAKGSIR